MAGLLVLGMMSGGCGRRDAEQALAASQRAIEAIPEEAQEFLALEYEQVEKTHEAARQSFSERNFKQAVAQAQSATAQAESLSVQVETRRAEFMREWSEFEATMPGMLAALAARAEEATKKLPAGVTAEALANAKTELEKLPRHWAQASSLAQNGQLVDAVLIGRRLKSQCGELATALAIPGATAAPTGAASQTPPAGTTP